MQYNRGITLTSLVITIIIILILAGTATYSGIYTLQSAKKTSFVTELKAVQAKVNLYSQKEESQYNNLGQEINENNVSQIQQQKIMQSTSKQNLDGFKYFYGTDYEDIELSGIKQETLINFKTKEVISVKGINLDGKLYYTLHELGEGPENIEYIDKTNSVNEI